WFLGGVGRLIEWWFLGGVGRLIEWWFLGGVGRLIEWWKFMSELADYLKDFFKNRGRIVPGI
ncbi:MAG: hypothetical protein DRN07_07805, partial [Thermoplasmata archaeon]